MSVPTIESEVSFYYLEGIVIVVGVYGICLFYFLKCLA